MALVELDGSDGRDEGEDCADDARVREVAGLLAGGGRVTGAQVGALLGVSERHGRRLLRAARQLNGPPIDDPDQVTLGAAPSPESPLRPAMWRHAADALGYRHDPDAGDARVATDPAEGGGTTVPRLHLIGRS